MPSQAQTQKQTHWTQTQTKISIQTQTLTQIQTRKQEQTLTLEKQKKSKKQARTLTQKKKKETSTDLTQKEKKEKKQKQAQTLTQKIKKETSTDPSRETDTKKHTKTQTLTQGEKNADPVPGGKKRTESNPEPERERITQTVGSDDVEPTRRERKGKWQFEDKAVLVNFLLRSGWDPLFSLFFSSVTLRSSESWARSRKKHARETHEERLVKSFSSWSQKQLVPDSRRLKRFCDTFSYSHLFLRRDGAGRRMEGSEKDWIASKSLHNTRRASWRSGMLMLDPPLAMMLEQGFIRSSMLRQ
jgi:hypothetical protein